MCDFVLFKSNCAEA